MMGGTRDNPPTCSCCPPQPPAPDPEDRSNDNGFKLYSDAFDALNESGPEFFHRR
jgi:hypothetical protein